MTRPWDDDGWEPDQPDEEAINEAKRREGLLRERVEELRRREPYFLDDLDLMRELQFMDELAHAWANGSLVGLTTAMDYCQRNRRPYPDWATEALRAVLLDMPHPCGAQDLGNMRKRHRQHEIDRLCHGMVCRLKTEGMTWEKAFAETSQLCQGTSAQGSASAMRDRYLKVNRAIKSGDAS